jgi:hypothetical protein
MVPLNSVALLKRITELIWDVVLMLSITDQVGGLGFQGSL